MVGFAKSAVHLYRTIWLEDVDLKSPDRPPIGPVPTCHIVESWDPFADDGASNSTNDRDVHVYSSGTEISLSVNGKAVGGKLKVGGWHDLDKESGATPGGVTFSSVAWEDGEITATCMGVSNGTMTHTRHTSKKAAKIVLRVDAPSPRTGTGKALLADGQDTALLAAMVVDEAGNIDHTSSANITFSIVSGPGKVVATHNGDVQNHEPNLATWHSAYHGLVRGIVRVTQNAASPPWHRSRLAEIDLDGHAGPTELIASGVLDATSIVVQASSPGLIAGRATIVLSTDESTDGVLAVAAASVTDPLSFE